MEIQILYIIFSILFLTECAPPPIPEQKSMIVPDAPKMTSIEKKSNLAFKRLNEAKMEIQNSTLTVKFYEDFNIEEHELIIVAKNLDTQSAFGEWSFSINSEGVDEIETNCENMEEPNVTCTGSTTPIEGETKIKFLYDFKLLNEKHLIIRFQFKKTKINRQVLYNQEAIIVPFFKDSYFCHYTFTIPDGYVNLGLSKNILKKESEQIYIYYGLCPTENGDDIIRFAPQIKSWKADTEIYLEYPQKFTNDITFIFPRYYKGGKLENTYYRIFSSENKSYREENIIYEDTKLKVENIPSKDKEKVSALLHTAFTNDLKNNFQVYFPESYYNIDLTDIPQQIKDKAQEIVANNPNEANYYSIGKFVNEYITYDDSYFGKKNYQLEDIYREKKGVCEHYTMLYNAMLNSIGIKSIYLSGWAFQGEVTSGDKQTIKHAWTAALIGDNWIELDATWGLFEGVPAGHILKNFFKDSFSFLWYENGDTYTFNTNPTIRMITDIKDMEDPYPPHIDEIHYNEADSTQKVDVDSTQKVDVDNTQKVDVDNTQKVDVDNTQKVDVDNTQKVDTDDDADKTQKNDIDNDSEDIDKNSETQNIENNEENKDISSFQRISLFLFIIFFIF